MKSQTCFFTGHRRLPQNEIPQIKKALEQAIISLVHKGVVYFGCGGALGFDTLATLAIISLKNKYPQIRLIMVLPCKEQTKYWQKEDIEIYNHILSCADKIVYTSQHYFSGCMQKRNRHMVKCSGYCISYLRQSFGGTYSTVRLAESMDISIIYL